MKRNLILFSLISAIASCGGSSGGNPETTDPTSPTVVNNAPTLSGELSLQTQAGVNSKFVYDLADQESDSVSVTIDNLPDWAAYAVNNNQLELSFDATLFDVSSHTLDVKLSDGKDTNDYQFSIVVTENREIWQDLTLSPTELTGYWHSDDLSTEVHFFKQEEGVTPERKGVFKNQGKTTELVWYYDSDDQLGLLTCVNACTERQPLETQILAQRDNEIKVLFTDHNEQENVVVLNLSSATEQPQGYYFPLDSGLTYKTASHFSSANKRFEIGFYNDIYLSRFTSSQSTSWLAAELPESGNVVTSFNNPVIDTIRTTSNHIEGTYGSYDEIYLNVVVDQVTFLPSIGGNIATEVKYHLELNTELNGITAAQINDIRFLPEILGAVRHSTSVMYPVNQVEVPTLSAGNRYQLARLSNAFLYSGVVDNLGIDLGGYNYVFESENSGYAEIINPIEDSVSKVPFTSSVLSNELVLDISEQSISMPFVQDNNGNIYALIHNLNELNTANIVTAGRGYLVKQLESFRDKIYTLADYKKTFKDISYQSLSAEPNKVIVDDHAIEITDVESGTVSRYIHKLEENGTLSYLPDWYCNNSENFDTCYQRRLDEGNLGTVRNLSIEKQEGNTVYLSYRSRRTGTEVGDVSFSYEFKRVYQIEE